MTALRNICRVVYVGPALSGRTTSLKSVLAEAGRSTKLHEISALTEYEFDRVVDGSVVRVVASVSAVRGWLWYEDPDQPGLDPRIRAEIDLLGRADGFVFVVDSQVQRGEAVREAYDRLNSDLRSREVDVFSRPTVFQVNKRDLRSLCSMDWVRQNLRADRAQYVESVASEGRGTSEAVDALLRLIVNR